MGFLRGLFMKSKRGKKETRRKAEKAKRQRRNIALATPPKGYPLLLFMPDIRNQSYETRNSILSDMGFGSYADYLNSDLWSGIRRLIWARRGSICVLCRSNNASELHHNSYNRDDLDGTVLFHIHPICNRCHKKIEFDSNGCKRSFQDVVAEFLRIVQGV